MTTIVYGDNEKVDNIPSDTLTVLFNISKPIKDRPSQYLKYINPETDEVRPLRECTCRIDRSVYSKLSNGDNNYYKVEFIIKYRVSSGELFRTSDLVLDLPDS